MADTITLLLAGAFAFYAQTGIDTVGGLVSSLGVVGTLVWYLYHNTTKTIPEITDRYTTTIEKITDKFSATLEQERVYRKEELDSLREWIKAEAGCRYNKENKDAT